MIHPLIKQTNYLLRVTDKQRKVIVLTLAYFYEISTAVVVLDQNKI